MDLREVKKRMRKENFYVPAFKETVTISSIEEKNGRKFGVGINENGETIRVDIRSLETANRKKDINSPTPFPEDKKEELEARENKVYEALRLIGRNRRYIVKALNPEMRTAMEKTMMTKVTHSKRKANNVVNSTVRTVHYANTALIALKIAEGLFPGDRDLALGIATCALLHDYGQCPFGHDGEQSAKKTSKSYNGGPVPHNSEGARRLYFREYDKIKDAINREAIIEQEAKKRVKEEINADEVVDEKEFLKRVKAKKRELEEDIDLRFEPELLKKIQNQTQQNGDLTDEAVKLIIMSAGNHNGERGTAKITPNYSITFEDFWKNIERTYLDDKANNQLEPCTIADAIAKLADQISSIPFDMIDGVRSGIENEIPNDWVKPVSQILQINEVEAKRRLEGNDNQLKVLALELQDKLIEDVIKYSNQRKIDMSLDEWLYGLNNKTGLRTPNIEHHTIHTSTEEEEVLLDNLYADLAEQLSKELLDEKGAFRPELNAIFRLPSNNPNRASMETELKDDFAGKEEARDFYDYTVETTSDEYGFYKRIVKERELQYFRDRIIKVLERNKNYAIPRSPRGTMEYAIETAIASGIEKVSPDSNGNYSDEQIKTMMENINTYLRNKPVDGISNLDVVAPKVTYGIGTEFLQKREIGTDEQIAARMVISYLNTLNDIQLLDLGLKLGLISEADVAKFYKPYTGKKDTGHPTTSVINTMGDYIDAEQEAGERE